MIIAIVPAAGKSQRMGRPKLLLPLGPRRVIEHVLDALTNSSVDRTIVVLPPDTGELLSVVCSFKVEAAQLAETTPDMRSSVIFGLERAEERAGDGKPAAFLVALADQPTLSVRVVNQLIDRFRDSPSAPPHPCPSPPAAGGEGLRVRGAKARSDQSKSIFIPTYRGKRGHPVLFSWSLTPRVRAIPPDRGLDWLVNQLGAEVEECPMDDLGLLEDLDTPEDYERLQRRNW